MSAWLLAVLSVVIWSVAGVALVKAVERLERRTHRNLPTPAVAVLAVLGGPLVWASVMLFAFYSWRARTK